MFLCVCLAFDPMGALCYYLHPVKQSKIFRRKKTLLAGNGGNCVRLVGGKEETYFTMRESTISGKC